MFGILIALLVIQRLYDLFSGHYMMEKARIDKTLDIKGINSPRLQELTVNTMESMYSGQVLRVITDDSSTRTTIPALCNKCGYMLVNTEEYDGALHYTIRK